MISILMILIDGEESSKILAGLLEILDASDPDDLKEGTVCQLVEGSRRGILRDPSLSWDPSR